MRLNTYILVILSLSLTVAACGEDSSKDKNKKTKSTPHHILEQVGVPDMTDEEEVVSTSSFQSPLLSAADSLFKKQTSLVNAHLEASDATFFNATDGIKVPVLIGVIDQGPIYPQHPDMKNVFHVQSTFRSSKRVSHAQFVAGIIAARSFNGVGIRGVMGTNSQILYLEAAAPLDIANNIRALAAEGAQVINISMGGLENCRSSGLNLNDNCHQPPVLVDTRIAKSMREAMSQYNVVIVIAAGNGSEKISANTLQKEGVIVVGASTASGYKKDFSNYGPGVSLFAIGDNVYGLTAKDYKQDEGTSFTTPIVSGAAALAVSYLKTHEVAYTPLDIKHLLLSSVVYSKKLKDKAEAAGHLDFGRLAESLKSYVTQATGAAKATAKPITKP